MKKSEKIFLYIIGGIILVILVGVGISNLSNQKGVTCNSPSIKVGNSCCLDQNSNNVCDNDEKKEPTLICEEYSKSLDTVYDQELGEGEWKIVSVIKNPNNIPLTLSCKWVIRLVAYQEEGKKIIENFEITIPANWEKSIEKIIFLPEYYTNTNLECQKIEDLPECWSN